MVYSLLHCHDITTHYKPIKHPSYPPSSFAYASHHRINNTLVIYYCTLCFFYFAPRTSSLKMSIDLLLHLVVCVSFLSVGGSIPCNVSLSYSYYEYDLRINCTVRCEVPELSEIHFRDYGSTDLVDFDNPRLPRHKESSYTISATGSFWGEMIHCQVRAVLICTVVIQVNATVYFVCNGTSARWPPYEGPFVTGGPDGDDEISVPPETTDDGSPRLLKSGRGKKCVEYGELHKLRRSRATSPARTAAATEDRDEDSERSNISLAIGMIFLSCVILATICMWTCVRCNDISVRPRSYRSRWFLREGCRPVVRL
ncbi:m119.1 [Muromegalovirus WP15B]|uniref:M119.1 n=1 Tax=Muromegalovirus WP15B TaxID=524651 RepID=B3UXN7_MUHV1|nr:m119.1 [Muromegalovirus WP15B]